MRVVIALGGNALLKRGEAMTAAHQRANIRLAAKSISEVMQAGHEVVITHGNGPQIGLLALQDAAGEPGQHFPLDVLSAETAGMIGYVLEQELANISSPNKMFATLLTQVEVNLDDGAFLTPSKPIGPVYDDVAAAALAKQHNWTIGADGDLYRRLVASPLPKRILRVGVIKLLLREGVTVICAGGGGIPVVRNASRNHAGVEAVIDKDRTSALLATLIDADALLMLTDVDGVYQDWGTAGQALISHMTPALAKEQTFAPGSMGPKIEAAVSFLAHGGKQVGIGRLEDALLILNGRAGTGFVE